MKWELIVLLMFLIACAKPAVEPAAKPAEPAAQPVADTGMMDIAKAVQLGKPIKCVSEQSGQTITIYMKGSKMRMDTVPADAHGIYTEDMMYTWQAKQGSVMKLEDIKALSEGAEQYKPKSQSEIIENAQKVNSKCEAYDVSESLFTPPADVQFQDLTEMMKQLEAMTKSLQK